MAKVAKLIAMYSVPEHDWETFERQYFESHVPLIQKVPGLRNMEVYRQPRNMMGKNNPYQLIATLTFDDLPALKAGMSSPEGQEAGNNIMSFASNYVTLLSSEVELWEPQGSDALSYHRVNA
jgi:uncharacterized protein (TIGR02118 family)